MAEKMRQGRSSQDAARKRWDAAGEALGSVGIYMSCGGSIMAV